MSNSSLNQEECKSNQKNRSDSTHSSKGLIPIVENESSHHNAITTNEEILERNDTLVELSQVKVISSRTQILSKSITVKSNFIYLYMISI